LFGDTSGLAAVLADGSQLLLRQRYSRDFEREADDVAWQYLLKANIDPRGMIRFFDRLKKEEQKYPQLRGSLQLLNTHPATAERMERLEEKWKKLDRKDGFRKLQ
jgi:predicted Zn-dependent protease